MFRKHKSDSDLDTICNLIHNLTNDEHHVVSKITTVIFDVGKLSVAFFLSSQLYGCVNPVTAAAPTSVPYP